MSKRSFWDNHWACIGLVPLLSMACGSKVQYVPQAPPQAQVAAAAAKIDITAEASPTINRDPNGDPLSVVVRLYQLKDKGEFSKLTFDLAASGRTDQELMGAEVLGKEEIVMVPGGKISRTDDVLPGAKYVGIVAFFRKPDPNYWRCLVSLDQTEPVEPEVPPAPPVVAPTPKPAATPAPAKAATPPPADTTAQRKNKRGRKAFEPTAKNPNPGAQAPPATSTPPPKAAETKPPAPAAPAKTPPPAKAGAAPKTPGANPKVNLMFRVEDCYLKILNLKPELIPGQPENEKPDCGSEATPPSQN